MKRVYKFKPSKAAEAKALYEVLFGICKSTEQRKHGDMQYATWFDLEKGKIVIEVKELED